MALGFALGAAMFFMGLPANGQGPGQAGTAGGGSCGPGAVCKPAAVQTKCIATGSLPACTASRFGQTRCDSTRGCTARCNEDAGWGCESGGSTATEPLVALAPITLYDDGGTVAIAFDAGFPLPATLQITDAARNVANITAGRTVTYSVSTSNTVFEAGDTCDVGFALNNTGGLAGTMWQCWPDDQLSITVRVACNAAADCDPASQTVFYTVTCPNGSCR